MTRSFNLSNRSKRFSLLATVAAAVISVLAAPALNSPLIQTLGGVLERGRRKGVFRAGIDPLQLYISIAGLAYFYLSNNHTLSAIFNRDLMSADARDERLAHICDVILRYVQKG